MIKSIAVKYIHVENKVCHHILTYLLDPMNFMQAYEKINKIHLKYSLLPNAQHNFTVTVIQNQNFKNNNNKLRNRKFYRLVYYKMYCTQRYAH